jgi:hypothetical protein
MSTSGQELLRSFDLLPEVEKREVASEIIRRAFSLDRNVAIDQEELETRYASFAAEDQELAEQGMEDYGKRLTTEDTQ